MNDPWSFGWPQLLTIVGFVITGLIAIGGFRTFGRWKREKLEEKKIEIALDASAIAYEAKYVFDNIRSPFSFEYEHKDMPKKADETELERGKRGQYYAILKRFNLNRDFFERAWRLQPRCMVVLGRSTENIFFAAAQGAQGDRNIRANAALGATWP
jgi:hypothetical protein